MAALRAGTSEGVYKQMSVCPPEAHVVWTLLRWKESVCMICPRDQRGLKIKAGIGTKGPGRFEKETAPESEEKVRNCGREMRTQCCSRRSAESTRCGSSRSQQGLGAGACPALSLARVVLGAGACRPHPPRGSAARGLSPSSSLNEGRGPGVRGLPETGMLAAGGSGSRQGPRTSPQLRSQHRHVTS